jgi:RNA polymerase sigma-70 factor (ECF subfamily)
MFRMGISDHEAVRAVLDGDKEAYGALVVRHSHSLFRVAFRITGNEADADDVVQEAFLRGYRKLGTFESGRISAPGSTASRCGARWTN